MINDDELRAYYRGYYNGIDKAIELINSTDEPTIGDYRRVLSLALLNLKPEEERK